MKFTNRLLLLSAILALSACSSLGNIVPGATKQDGGQNTTEQITEVNDERASTGPTVDGQAPGEAVPEPKSINPYLANPKPISVGIDSLFQRALKVHRLQNWSEAELAWQEITLTAPTLSGPYVNLGIVYEATERLEEAERAYQFAIDTNPLNVDAYNQLAILKRKAGKFSEAEALYKKALEVWPEHPASHRNIAILYDLYMGKLELALSHYQEYESLLDEPDRALKGWISDLRRRLDSSS